MLEARNTRYEPTAEDRLWLKRAVAREGQPLELVAQTLINGFLWARAEQGFKRTLTDWVRAYSKPVNPMWYRTGERLRRALEMASSETERERMLNEAWTREHVYSARNDFPSSVTDAVESALSKTPTRYLEATDFAAPQVQKSADWKAHTVAVQGQNRLWTRPGAIGWTGYRVTDSLFPGGTFDGEDVPVGGLLLTALAAAAAFVAYRFIRG